MLIISTRSENDEIEYLNNCHGLLISDITTSNMMKSVGRDLDNTADVVGKAVRFLTPTNLIHELVVIILTV